jgi:hypothetical protein
LGVANRAEYKEMHKKDYKAPCYHCFVSPQINWNGKILGCSVNKWKTIGDVNEMSISEWENSQYHKTMVEILFEGKECPNTIPCFYCPNYQKIKEKPLSIEGLKEYTEYVAPALR